MEIVIAIIGVGIFVFMLVFLINIFAKKSKTDTVKPKLDTPKEEKKESKKEDIPEILTEVTQGNYMYDIANENDNAIPDMVENDNIKEENISKKPVSMVEESFDKIEAIKDDYREDKLLNTQAILNDLDGVDDSEQPDEVKEFKGLSNRTKALIISDLLKKKK